MVILIKPKPNSRVEKVPKIPLQVENSQSILTQNHAFYIKNFMSKGCGTIQFVGKHCQQLAQGRGLKTMTWCQTDLHCPCWSFVISSHCLLQPIALVLCWVVANNGLG